MFKVEYVLGKIKLDYLAAGIIGLSLLFLYYLLENFGVAQFTPQKIFIFELLGYQSYIKKPEIIFFQIGNLGLLWLISRHLFKDRLSLLPLVIYGLSPWSNYLTLAGSFYIYLLFGLLAFSYGFLLSKEGRRSGVFLSALAAILLIYSSIFFLIIVPLFLILLTRNRVLLLLLAPILIFIVFNFSAFKNVFNTQFSIFKDPGLINNINEYQGNAQKEGMGFLAKISENKYIFTGEYMVVKFLKQFTPATYFTSHEQLLNFSFLPPLYLGLLIPLIYGLYRNSRTSKQIILIFISLALVIPSLLSEKAMDLNRLILFLPIILYLITSGFDLLYQLRRINLHRFLLSLTLFLVVFQLMLTISDIYYRENNRFIKRFENWHEVGKQ